MSKYARCQHALHLEIISESLFYMAVEGHCPVLTPVIHNELVHAPRSQGSAHSFCDNLAGIDVADKLGDPLRGVRPLLQQDNWCWLKREPAAELLLQTRQPADSLELIPHTDQQATIMRKDQDQNLQPP